MLEIDFYHQYEQVCITCVQITETKDPLLNRSQTVPYAYQNTYSSLEKEKDNSQNMKKKAYIISLLLLMLLGRISPILAFEKDACFSVLWPHEKSSLQADPSISFGRFKNGFRYVLMENKEPQHRVGLYLNVQAGSLNETKEQQGAAHFLEHMMFNGSIHFQPGELVEYFQSIGMDFGRDTNAHTSYDETVYKIILPSGKMEEVDKGLLVMRDYARGALLLEEEVSRERGVIFSEKRARDSASYRAQVKSSAFSLQGTKIPKRQPIGITETLEKIDQKTLKAFYDSWYRPNNMVLVVVGDFSKKDIAPLLQKHFQGIIGAGPEPKCPSYGNLQRKGRNVNYQYVPELGVTKVSIETIWEQPLMPDSKEVREKKIREYVVSQLLNFRIGNIMDNPSTPFTDGMYYTGDLMGFLGYSGITAETSPDKWQATLKNIEQVIRQALLYGFLESELLRVKKNIYSHLESAVLTKSTRNSKDLASGIIRSLNTNRVFQSPDQELEILGQYIDDLHLSDVHDTLKKLWSSENRFIEIVGNTKIKEEPEKEIERLYLLSQNEPLRKWSSGKKVQFPYLDFNSTHILPVHSERFENIDMERYHFENGVVVNMKQTTFKKNVIQMRIDVPGGRLIEKQAGMGMFVEAIVNESGFGKLSQSEVDVVLTGSTVSFAFSVERAHFSWRGTSLSKDIELLLQILQTAIVDPGFREDVYKNVKERYRQYYLRMDSEIQSGMHLFVNRFLAGGHFVFGWPKWEEFSSITFQSLQEWVKKSLSSGKIEISVVGDFNKKQLVTLCEKYFGNLNKRDEFEPTRERIIFPLGQTTKKTISSSIEKALVVLAWPTADFWNIAKTRRLNMLARILDDRLRIEIREKLGAAYSPVVYNYSSRNFHNYGFLLARMVVEPEKVASVRDIVLSITKNIQKDGVTEDELTRAKAPTMTSLRGLVRDNKYWLNSVLARSSGYPQQLQWPQTLLLDYKSITREELSILAKEYLKPELAATAFVLPE